MNTEQINNGTTFNTTVTGLLKYTEYEFKVLAFTSVGDGPNSSVKIERTNADGEYTTRKMFLATSRVQSESKSIWTV